MLAGELKRMLVIVSDFEITEVLHRSGLQGEKSMVQGF